jgi:hypothetical protein
MNPTEIRETLRRFAALGSAVVLLTLAATPALADDLAGDKATQINDIAISQAGAIKGSQAGVGVAGGAVSGPSVTVGAAVVHQQDVQVVALVNQPQDPFLSAPGGSATGSPAPTASVTSSSSATVNQAPTASAGTASVTDSGLATTGAASAVAVTVVDQTNRQIVAGWVPEGGVSLDASNTANISQSPSAAAGNATASGGGTATSGSAAAVATTHVDQSNLQIFLGLTPYSGAQTQSSSNSADISQSPSARSGNAIANGGEATTGDAYDTNRWASSQSQRSILMYW